MSYTQGRRLLKIVLYEFFGQDGGKIQLVFRAKRQQNSTFFAHAVCHSSNTVFALDRFYLLRTPYLPKITTFWFKTRLIKKVV